MNLKKSLGEYFVTLFVCSAMIAAGYCGYEMGKMERPPWKVLKLEKSISVSAPECEITANFKDKEALESYGPCNAQSFLEHTLKELSWEMQVPKEAAPLLRLEQGVHLMKKEEMIKNYQKIIGNTNSLPSMLFNNPPEKLEKNKDEYQEYRDRT